jgi:pimeloyl-ACP methyl ester carboxylesterase
MGHLSGQAGEGEGVYRLSDVDIFAQVRGAGEPLVLVHGFAGDLGLWDAAWEPLSAGRRAVRYDLRGFGRSRALNEGPYRHQRDLEALLDRLEIQQCDLLGVSMGGAVALGFALDRPQRVRRLVLVSPALTAWDWSDEWRARWADIRRAARSGDLERARDLWWRHPIFETTRTLPAAAEVLRRSLAGYSGKHWVQVDPEEAAFPDLDRLHELAAPTLLLTGSCDLPDFRLIAELIEAAAPAVERKDFPGAGHLLHLEHPTAFAEDVLRFLAPPR